jgi:hypothetical protein
MLGDIEVDDTATIVLQDDEDIEDSQTNRCDCEEKQVTRNEKGSLLSKLEARV